MKLTKKIALAGAAVLIAGTVSAQTSVPNSFEAGDEASATEVNANFAALVSAVNALSARVDILEADPSVTQEDLAGRTYCISFFGNLGGINETADFARVSSYVGSGKIAFTTSELGSLTLSFDREFELGWNLGFDGSVVLDTTINSYDWLNGPVPAGESPDGTDPVPVAVNSLTNGVLSLTLGGPGGDDENFNISTDGSMLLSSSFYSDTEESETNLIMGMRCD